jgi:hypothetical protein
MLAAARARGSGEGEARGGRVVGRERRDEIKGMIQIILSTRFEWVREEGLPSNVNRCIWWYVKYDCNLFGGFSGGYGYDSSEVNPVRET